MKDQEYMALAGIADEGQQTSETPTPTNDAPTGATTEGATTGQPDANQFVTFYVDGKETKLPANAELALTHGGKILRNPLSKYVNQVRQFEHLQDKYKSFNEEKSAWEAQREENERAKAFYDKWGQFQDWSEKNPDQWQKLWDIYQNKDKHLLESQLGQQGVEGQGPNLNPLVSEITSLKQELAGLKEWKTHYDTQEERAQDEADVQAVKSEIDTYKEKWPEINFEEANPDGTPLWAEIIQYGLQHKIPSYEAAAAVYLQPRLIEVAQHRARTEATKSQQSQYKAGIVAKSQSPFVNKGQVTPAINFKNVGYGELAEIARREYDRLSAQS